jgi:hypothetical protein
MMEQPNFPEQKVAPAENLREQETATPVDPPDECTKIASSTSSTSPLKVEANRRNAQDSCGPRTPEGKKASSRNATRHGLLVKDVVIKSGAGQEDEAEFEALLAALRNEYKPEGIAQDLLVREIAISYWRSARALRCERGAVTEGSGMCFENPELRFWEAKQAFKSAHEDDPRPDLLPTLPGLTYLLQVIEGIREEVNDSDSMPEDAYPWLSPTRDWEALSGKEEILAALEDETQELIKIKGEMDNEESYQSEATTELSAIPSK